MAGAFAGASARLVTAPFDVLKIRFQLQFAEKVKYTSVSQAFKTVIQEEGIIGLWKGNVAATYLWISYAMVQFGVYGFLKKNLERIPDPFIATSQPGGAASIFGHVNDSSHKGLKGITPIEQANVPTTGQEKTLCTSSIALTVIHQLQSYFSLLRNQTYSLKFLMRNVLNLFTHADIYDIQGVKYGGHLFFF